MFIPTGIRHLTLLICAFLITSCNPATNNHFPFLYHSEQFSVYPDSVVQGKYKAFVNAEGHLVSNYKSPASANYSNMISFKLTINEKDIEMPSGKDHHISISPGEHESAVIVFGQPDRIQPENTGIKLPPNYPFTFHIDMRPVLEQFSKRGYYEAFDRSKIAQQDVKGFYIAGGSAPLTWDFSNLSEKGLELKDDNNDGIYSITLQLNPYNETQKELKSWQPSEDISRKPAYASDQPLVDALFRLATEEGLKNIEPDSTLRTGAEWGGVWTRDISYSIYLAFAYQEPEIARISLMKKVKRGRIIQDTGSGGAWPISSDRVVWALAAWEIYQVTGDRHWLTNSYEIIKKTLDDDYKTLAAANGLYRGESSFLDWREQTYPKWMDNVDIAESQNLGTNVVHYQANMIAAKMARALGEDGSRFTRRADTLKNSINRWLWQENRGFYGQYLYGRKYMNRSPRFEALGEALAVLFEIAGPERSERILSESPVTPFGVTCIYPQIPGVPSYHNNAVWPFVQSYWNLAAAKVGNEKALTQGLAAIYRPAALFLSNYENFVAENGDFQGTEINSGRMLWSIAGNLAMVHRIFMGMHFTEEGITFRPVVPHTFNGTKTLSDFRYRNALLTVSVHGTGNQIKEFRLDGHSRENSFIEGTLTGEHKIEIFLANNDFDSVSIHPVVNHFSLPPPQLKHVGDLLTWEPVDGALAYRIYENGRRMKDITAFSSPVKISDFVEYKVSAVDSKGISSFTSEPLWIYKNSRKMELEDFATSSSQHLVNYSGDGFIRISTDENRDINLTIDIERAGDYLINVRYSNGSGPWNTDNKAAIRSLYVNDHYEGVMIFPQRGKDEWSDWGNSNSKSLHLKKGSNTFHLRFEEWNNNMNVNINIAMLDYLLIIPTRYDTN